MKIGLVGVCASQLFTVLMTTWGKNKNKKTNRQGKNRVAKKKKNEKFSKVTESNGSGVATGDTFCQVSSSATCHECCRSMISQQQQKHCFPALAYAPLSYFIYEGCWWVTHPEAFHLFIYFVSTNSSSG